MQNLKVIIPLLLVYLGLTGNWEPLNWLLGALLAAGITALIRPQIGPIRWQYLPRAIWGGFTFFVSLLRDLLISSLQVSMIVLSPKMEIHHGIYRLATGCDNELVTVLSAHAITLTPGEMVVEIDQSGEMYVHSIDLEEMSAEVGTAAQVLRTAKLQEVLG